MRVDKSTPVSILNKLRAAHMPTVTVQESDCAPAISAVALPSVLVLEVVGGCVGSVTLS